MNQVKSGLAAVLLLFAWISPGYAADYRKSTEGHEVVMNKIYPKKKKLELSGGAGYILNQSYVNTFLITGGLNYYFSEEWGMSLDFSMGQNEDKPERGCIENFYNDPLEKIDVPCGGPENISDTSTKANYGPAYVPIREIDSILAANVVWSPVYGKQLILLSTTSYFDLFIEAGGAIVSSKYYPKKTDMGDNRVSRGTFKDDGSQPDNGPRIGAEIGEEHLYGVNGRPEAEAQSNVALNLGLGQKFHFGKRFQLKMYIRNLTIVGTESGFENLFALYLGAGVRF